MNIWNGSKTPSSIRVMNGTYGELGYFFISSQCFTVPCHLERSRRRSRKILFLGILDFSTSLEMTSRVLEMTVKFSQYHGPPQDGVSRPRLNIHYFLEQRLNFSNIRSKKPILPINLRNRFISIFSSNFNIIAKTNNI